MKILNIVETAYRATIEEQDDTILWFTQALRGAGAEASVLLAESAVNYAVRSQDASGLAFGDIAQTQPPQLAADLGRLLSGGATLYVVEEDLSERGIESADLIPGLKMIRRADLAQLVETHDHVWRW